MAGPIETAPGDGAGCLQIVAPASHPQDIGANAGDPKPISGRRTLAQDYIAAMARIVQRSKAAIPWRRSHAQQT
jgi:hypothetical protein